MKEKDITLRIRECEPSELPEQDRCLIEAAKAATRNSLAPYSRFHVGAAILMDNGEIVSGSNQENAAFTSGTCAERSACFYASSRYPGVPMRKIAIAAWTDKDAPADAGHDDLFQAEPVSPCGACRQALMEYENMYGPIELLLYGRDRTYVVPSVASLLPLTFTEF